MDETGRDPVAEARRWLKSQGYELEHEAARRLTDSDFFAALGRTYVDRDTTKVREIDVIARPLLRDSTPVDLYTVVECKRSSHPWIVRKAMIPDDQLRWRPIASAKVVKYADTQPDWRPFRLPEPTGFAVLQVQGPKDRPRDTDPAYAALAQVVDAARGAFLSGFIEDRPSLVHPMILLDAPLLTLSYEEDGTEDLAEVKWQRIVWGGASHPVTIDIVIRSEFEIRSGALYTELERLNLGLRRSNYDFRKVSATGF